eukprot:6843625-Lingulodinium_polyedra.AAC.1
MLIWWFVPNDTPQDAQPTSVFHAGARLGDNRAGLLIDTGARGNLSGDAWVQEQALLSKKA